MMEEFMNEGTTDNMRKQDDREEIAVIIVRIYIL